MKSTLICLSLLALIVAGTAYCELYELVKIPASQDVTIDTDKETVVADTDTLRCEVNVTDDNGTVKSSFTGVPMIQFNISSLEMTKNDIGILVLKAASIQEKGNESAIIAMMPAASDWNEKSSYNNLFFNLIPGIEIIQSNDIARMGVSTDGNGIYAFDVSKRLLDAKDEGNNVSFILMAICNNSYRVDFNSRESGEGPYLMVIPYPARPAINRTSVSLHLNERMINESIEKITNETESLINQSLEKTFNKSLNQTLNQSINRTFNITFSQTEDRAAVPGPDANEIENTSLKEIDGSIVPPKH
jgi:hypothetical protein